jgi:hypothetical protein
MTELFLRSDPFAELSAGIGNGAAAAKDFFGKASITS